LTKKAQGLPIYAIVIILLGIIILAVVLLYILTVTGRGSEAAQTFFGFGGNVTENATETAGGFGGG
jgi:hypothetical protein